MLWSTDFCDSGCTFVWFIHYLIWSVMTLMPSVQWGHILVIPDRPTSILWWCHPHRYLGMWYGLGIMLKWWAMHFIACILDVLDAYICRCVLYRSFWWLHFWNVRSTHSSVVVAKLWIGHYMVYKAAFQPHCTKSKASNCSQARQSNRVGDTFESPENYSTPEICSDWMQECHQCHWWLCVLELVSFS